MSLKDLTLSYPARLLHLYFLQTLVSLFTLIPLDDFTTRKTSAAVDQFRS